MKLPKAGNAIIAPEKLRDYLLNPEMFEDVIVTIDVPRHDIRAGDVGTVVEHHVVEGKEDGYSVEFFGVNGETRAVVALPASHLRRPKPGTPLTSRKPSQAE